MHSTKSAFFEDTRFDQQNWRAKAIIHTKASLLHTSSFNIFSSLVVPNLLARASSQVPISSVIQHLKKQCFKSAVTSGRQKRQEAGMLPSVECTRSSEVRRSLMSFQRKDEPSLGRQLSLLRLQILIQSILGDNNSALLSRFDSEPSSCVVFKTS